MAANGACPAAAWITAERTLPDHVVGSGNVFADLGHPDPDTALAQDELAHRIVAEIAARGLTQAAAAELLDVDQPKISAIARGRLRDFSLDRLRLLANRIGLDVTLTVSAAPEGRPGRTVVVAREGAGAS